MGSIACRYSKDVFIPLSPKAIQGKFQDGELVFLRVDRKRHWPGHQAFMALMNDAFETMPDNLREEYTSPDVLRRRLLIAAGFANIDSIVCKNNDDAIKTAYKMAKFTDDHTFLSLRGSVVVIARANSQAMDKMDADTFKKSCQAVQEELAKLLGCSVWELREHVKAISSKEGEATWTE